MRSLVLLIVNIVLVSALFFWRPNQAWKDLDQGGNYLLESLNQILYQKEIRTLGLSRVKKKEVHQILPLEKSVLWWKFNLNKVEDRLLVNPMIESALVTQCEDSSWGCFSISINEREPKFIAIMGADVWLLGEDGGFIAPLRSQDLPATKDLKNIAPQLSKVVLIKGLIEKDLSPDILEVKINLLSSILEVVESNTKLKVKEMIIDQNSDVSIKFAKYDFLAKFDLNGGNLDKVQDQTQRLKKILSRYGSGLADLAEVDLAFDKMAVVRKQETFKKELPKK